MPFSELGFWAVCRLAVTLLASGVVVLWSVLAVAALARVRARRSRLPRSGESVSVLKPLAGVDQALDANLRGFFEQTHPSYEIVFGVQDPRDPALAVARRLKTEYPDVPCRIVVHDAQGMNPKVGNLRAMLAAVHHDLVVISDSNVAVSPGWLNELAAELEQPGVGLVFNPIAGVGERSLGATLENLQLCGPLAAGMAVPTELFGHPTVVGKSMLFRRSVFERLGGFESVASVLAEDYVMGRMFKAAGFRVRMAPTPVRNVSETTSVHAFFARQVRWAMLRLRLQPVAYVLEPLTSPIAFALLTVALGLAPGVVLLWALLATLVRDALLMLLLRGPRGLGRALPLIPLRELLMLAVFVSAPLHRHVSWRGHRLRLSAGTRLYAEHPLPTPTLLRIEG
jgi:ceramide glucosyltransferase